MPIVGKALAKNPAQRYGTMAEMARAVDALGDYPRAEKPIRPKVEKPLDVLPVEPSKPVLTALPATSWRGHVAELCGSMGLATLVAAIAAVLWAVPGELEHVTDIGSFFFQMVLVCWAVLIPAKIWGSCKTRSDSWKRRLLMLGVGAAVGACALWLNGGWLLRTLPNELNESLSHTPTLASFLPTSGVAEVAAYLSYFGLIFFAVRWWKMAASRRQHRFSFFPTLAVGFWSLILLLIWPQVMNAAVVLVVSSVVVQLVSPWDGPMVPVSRKARPPFASA